MTKATTKEDASQTKALGRSLAEFKASYDKSFIVPKKIREALAKLGDGWLRELDFAKLAGVSANDLASHRAEFEEDHVVALNGSERGRRAWAGTKRTATRMREMLG